MHRWINSYPFNKKMYPNIFDSDLLLDYRNATTIRQAYAASIYTGTPSSCSSAEKKEKEGYK
jgi:hypothetical protein